jgi:hypothetical protein
MGGSWKSPFGGTACLCEQELDELEHIFYNSFRSSDLNDVTCCVLFCTLTGEYEAHNFWISSPHIPLKVWVKYPFVPDTLKKGFNDRISRSSPGICLFTRIYLGFSSRRTLSSEKKGLYAGFICFSGSTIQSIDPAGINRIPI